MTLLGWSSRMTRPTGKANGGGLRSHQPRAFSVQPEERRRVDIAAVTAWADPKTHVHHVHRRTHCATRLDAVAIGDGDPHQSPDDRLQRGLTLDGDHQIGQTTHRADEFDRSGDRSNDHVTANGCDLETTISLAACTRRWTKPVGHATIDRENRRRRQTHHGGDRRDHARGSLEVCGRQSRAKLQDRL